MIVISAVDDSLGMTFNNRRVSRDSELVNKIAAVCKNGKLMMNGYSANLFGEADISVDEDFLNHAASGDFCFVENVSLIPYEEKIEKVILFRWNRRYPADFFFDLDLNNSWKLTDSEDFPGNSHDRITMEIYEK